ncbi:hypothetical protein, partial [Pseudomonas aeruginosa]
PDPDPDPDPDAGVGSFGLWRTDRLILRDSNLLGCVNWLSYRSICGYAIYWVRLTAALLLKL